MAPPPERRAGRAAAALLALLPLACSPQAELAGPEMPDPAGLDPAVAAWVERARTWANEHPGEVEEWLKLCMTYHANALWEAAEVCYVRAVEMAPGRPRGWYYLALVRESRGDVAGALAAVKRSQEAFAHYAPAHAREAAWLLASGRLDEADAAFGRVLDIAPDDPAARMGTALVRLERGDAAAAVTILEEAQGANPGHAGVAALLDEARRRVAGAPGDGPPIGADELGGRVVGNDPWGAELQWYLVGFDARFEAADERLAERETESAVVILEALREQHPDDVRVLLRLGQAHEHAGDLGAARQVLEEAVRVDPGDWRTHVELAAVLEAQGDSKAALDHAESGVALGPEESLSWSRKGHLLYRAGRFPEALDAFVRASALAPDDKGLLRMAGDCYTRLARWTEAATTYESALALGDADPELQVRAAFAYIKLGRLAEAETALARALELDTPHREAVTAMLEQVRAGLPSAPSASPEGG